MAVIGLFGHPSNVSLDAHIISPRGEITPQSTPSHTIELINNHEI